MMTPDLARALQAATRAQENRRNALLSAPAGNDDAIQRAAGEYISATDALYSIAVQIQKQPPLPGRASRPELN